MLLAAALGSTTSPNDEIEAKVDLATGFNTNESEYSKVIPNSNIYILNGVC